MPNNQVGSLVNDDDNTKIILILSITVGLIVVISIICGLVKLYKLRQRRNRNRPTPDEPAVEFNNPVYDANTVENIMENSFYYGRTSTNYDETGIYQERNMNVEQLNDTYLQVASTGRKRISSTVDNDPTYEKVK